MIRIISHLSWISATLPTRIRQDIVGGTLKHRILYNSMIRRPVLTRKCYFFIAVPMDKWFKISNILCVYHCLSFIPCFIPLSHHYPIISHIFSRKIPKLSSGTSRVLLWNRPWRTGAKRVVQPAIGTWRFKIYVATWHEWDTSHVLYMYIIYILYIYVCVCAYAYASVCIHIEYV